MTQLKQWNQLVGLKILDNESSAEYKTTIQDIWRVEYQAVPANLHIHNADKCSICTFKAHFLWILAGIAEYFPKNMWDLLIPQTEMTLNLLQQSTLKPDTSAWVHLNGPISYNHAQLGSLGFKFIMKKKN